VTITENADTVAAFVKMHEAAAARIVFVLAFGESFVSL
jgi:hypothetical protein